METLAERLSNALTLAVHGEDATGYLALVCSTQELIQLRREAQNVPKRLELIQEALKIKELTGAGV